MRRDWMTLTSSIWTPCGTIKCAFLLFLENVGKLYNTGNIVQKINLVVNSHEYS